MADEILYVLWTLNDEKSLETRRLYRLMDLNTRRESC